MKSNIWKRYLRRYALRCVLAVVALLAAGEVALRATLGLGNPPLMIADAEVGYLFKPNQHLRRFGNRIVYNQFHQRSDPTTAVPAAGVRRVMILGDSVTNGGALTDQQDTVSEQLERILSDTQKCEVLAASVTVHGFSVKRAGVRARVGR